MRIQIKHNGGEIRSGDKEKHRELMLDGYVLIDGEIESVVRSIVIQLPFEVRRDMKWNGKILKIEVDGKEAEIAGNDDLIYIRGDWLTWYNEAVRAHNARMRAYQNKFQKIYINDPHEAMELLKNALFKLFGQEKN